MRFASLALLVALLALSGCAEGGSPDRPVEGRAATAARAELNRATDPRRAEFPAVRGRTLQEVADAIGVTGTEVGLATTVVRTSDRARIAFGVIDEGNRFVYGPTAVYAARAPGARARGPFPAPADLLVTEAPFRSRQAASEEDAFAAVYEAHPALDRPGRWYLLVVTRVGDELVAAPATVRVRAPGDDPVPGPGEPAPVVSTDTLESAGGDVEAIETRQPPDDMHDVDFRDVVGRRPVALLFATPQLCTSRVCGPVVDIAAQLKERYGDRVAFIHQEVYVDNDPSKGLRPSLRRFGLPTEPWLFTVDRRGRIAARLEGSFGLRAFEDAIRQALR